MANELANGVYNIDLSDDGAIVIPAMQYDKNSRKCVFYISNKGEVITLSKDVYTVRIKYKNGNVPAYHDLTINPDGSATFTITDDMTQIAGDGNAQLVLNDAVSDRCINSRQFIIKVGESVFPNDEIVTTEQFDAITNLMLRADADIIEMTAKTVDCATKTQDCIDKTALCVTATGNINTAVADAIAAKEACDTSAASANSAAANANTKAADCASATADCIAATTNAISETQKLTDIVKKTDVVDNLTSTDIDKPLSANMGRELNNNLLNNYTKTEDMGNVITPKESVKWLSISSAGYVSGETVLPTTGNSIGDQRKVDETGHFYQWVKYTDTTNKWTDVGTGDAGYSQLSDVLRYKLPVTWIEGEFIHIDTGTKITSAFYRRTEPIKVLPNTTIEFYTCYSETAGAYFYDSNGIGVGNVLSTNAELKLTTYVATVPENADTFIYSCNNKVSTDEHNFVKISNIVPALTLVGEKTKENKDDINILKKKKEFSTVKDMIANNAIGVNRVGGYLFSNIVDSPKIINHKEDAHKDVYYDVQNSVKQYRIINKKDVGYIPSLLMNNLNQEEIDFTPADNGYTRIIVGKSDDDVFFVNYVASNINGAKGNELKNMLETTRDFKTFTSVWKDYRNFDVDGLKIPNIGSIDVKSVKQFMNGNYLIGATCYRADLNESTTNFFLMNPTMSSISLLKTLDFDGNTIDMKDPNAGNIYDWHIDIKGSKAIVSTYGTRNPETCMGIVWYTENNGVDWKQVFKMTNHYQDGVAPDSAPVTQTHVHGVMLDPYANRMFVIAGEDNRNIFWTDKGINATDTDWNVIPIREQLVYPFQAFTQVVNGYAFKDCLIFGSDNPNIGVIFRINKLDDGSYSNIEPAYEFTPNAFSGNTYYCAAEMYRRDFSTPLLFCQTRENCMLTEENNELLNQRHKARVVATFDGINFTEIWSDSTYGSHDVHIGNEEVQRNYSYCTRGMQCYLLKNGNAVIKYAGRDWYMFGGNPLYSATGYSNGSCKVRVIKNIERYLIN